jgi:hypothetical protein
MHKQSSVFTLPCSRGEESARTVSVISWLHMQPQFSDPCSVCMIALWYSCLSHAFSFFLMNAANIKRNSVGMYTTLVYSVSSTNI